MKTEVCSDRPEGQRGSNLGRIINETGLCIPLAAELLAVIERSGASQMEITTSLAIMQHLRHHLKASLVNEELAASW